MIIASCTRTHKSPTLMTGEEMGGGDSLILKVLNCIPLHDAAHLTSHDANNEFGLVDSFTVKIVGIDEAHVSENTNHS